MSANYIAKLQTFHAENVWILVRNSYKSKKMFLMQYFNTIF